MPQDVHKILFLLPQSLRLPKFCHVVFDLIPCYQCMPSIFMLPLHFFRTSMSPKGIFLPLEGIVTGENTKIFQNRLWRTAWGTHQYEDTFSTTHLISFLIHFTVQLLIPTFSILISHLLWNTFLKSREIISVRLSL